MDFFPFSAFETAEETASWARAWTGNPTYTAREFLFFGKDGCGGYAALWLTNGEGTLEEQPVVFLGSEGETAVLARDLYDYLWLLAGGFGPQEAVFYPESRRVPVAAFERLAEKYAPTRRKGPRCCPRPLSGTSRRPRRRLPVSGRAGRPQRAVSRHKRAVGQPQRAVSRPQRAVSRHKRAVGRPTGSV